MRPLLALLLCACVGSVDNSGEEGADDAILISTMSASPRITTGSTTISWSSPALLPRVLVSCDDAPESLFASGAAGSSVAPWVTAGHTCNFVLRDLYHRVLRSVTVLGAQSTGGAIGATPSLLSLAPGTLGSTTIDWGTLSNIDAQVWVSMDGAAETLFAHSPQGPQSADWIQLGHVYAFTLYAGTGHAQALARVTVFGVSPGAGAITAEQNPVIGRRNGATAVIDWAASSGASQVWVSVNGAAEQLFASGGRGSQAATWITLGATHDFRLYDGTAHATLLAQVRVTAVPPFLLGADYHATSSDLGGSDFLTRYSDPTVRQLVRNQLQGMADAGANAVKTTVWFGPLPGYTADPQSNYLIHFPPTATETANLRTYALDVASIVARDGHRLRLDVSLGYNWQANYGAGSWTTMIGEGPIAPDLFASYARASTHAIVDAVAGTGVVDRVYLDGEVMIDEANPTGNARPNADWFVLETWSDFVAYANSKNVTPSMYFWAGGSRDEITGSQYAIDPVYPVLNYHHSAQHVYRTLLFLQHRQLPLPARIDFSLYAEGDLVTRVLDDVDAAMAALGLHPGAYGVAECYEDPAVGAALAGETRRVASVRFWPITVDMTPTGYPFNFASFLLP
jgi:hypothetical protein